MNRIYICVFFIYINLESHPKELCVNVNPQEPFHGIDANDGNTFETEFSPTCKGDNDTELSLTSTPVSLHLSEQLKWIIVIIQLDCFWWPKLREADTLFPLSLSDVSYVRRRISREPLSKRVILPQPKEHAQKQPQLLPLARCRRRHWSSRLLTFLFKSVPMERAFPNSSLSSPLPGLSFPEHSRQSLRLPRHLTDHWSWRWLFWFRPWAGNHHTLVHKFY